MSLVSLFRAQAARSPDAVALLTDTRQITYAELDSWTDSIAAALPSPAPEAIGLRLPRSPEMIAWQLAVLKAGAAYVPLDRSYPQARLDMMGRIAGVEMVVDNGWTACASTNAAAEHAAAPRRRTPDSIAYIMFTSGTTGTPKAVKVMDRNIANLCTHPGYVRLDDSETLVHLAPASFDAATFEIWGALLNGARLVVPDDRPMNTDDIENLVQRHGITTMWLTAALFHQVVGESQRGLKPVRQLLTGGDIVSPAHVRQALGMFPGRIVVNGYGPTETTTFATCHPMRDPAEVDTPVPIGRPIRNARIHIVDGEIWIAGAGVSAGYVGEDTEGRFVAEPGNPGAIAYRSGDFGRCRPDGVIEFQGRVDAQIKVRGYRIEPVEIEQELLRIDGIRQAVVEGRSFHGGEKRLVAYLSLEQGLVLDKRDVRKRLASWLPRHMLPSAYLTVDKIPLTANGKVDRRALPEPPWELAGDPLLRAVTEMDR